MKIFIVLGSLILMDHLVKKFQKLYVTFIKISLKTITNKF